MGLQHTYKTYTHRDWEWDYYIQYTYTQVWNVDYLWTDHFNGRAVTGLVDPYGSVDWCNAGTAGLTSTRPTQRAPPTDGVTRGQTLGARGEGVTHVHGVTEKL